MTSKLLSKSQFSIGLQCYKALWLRRYKPEIRKEADPSMHVRREAGREINRMAQKLFPNGVTIKQKEFDPHERMRRTLEELSKGTTTIYEATFIYKDVYAIADILHQGEKGWEIYEIRPATGNKGYEYDLALKYFVLHGCGITIDKASLIHINNKYVRKGMVDFHKLFRTINMTRDVRELQILIERELEHMKEVLSDEMPHTGIGEYCKSPYECSYFSHCWSDIPDYSVFDITSLAGYKKFHLYNSGILEFHEIPKDYHLTDNQRLQIECELTDKVHVNKKDINEFLKDITYPLYFLDFEAFQKGIPPFDGLFPYTQIPFQYSLHYVEDEKWLKGLEGNLKHKEFLAEEGKDPREPLIRRLIEDIPENACILVYNAKFEKLVIGDLAKQFPQYAEKLLKINENIYDLMTPFQEKLYYNKEMKGRHSIKAVLPALAPEFGYEGMEVADGRMASNLYSRLHLNEEPEEVEKIKAGLLEYCSLDTFAMVKLLEKLIEVTKDEA